MPQVPQSPPPEISVRKSTPTFECVVAAQGIPADAKLSLDGLPEHLRPPVTQVFAGIFNARDLLVRIVGAPDTAEAIAAWAIGPWGQHAVSLQRFFGEYTPELARAVYGQLTSALRPMSQAQPLRVQAGGTFAYDPQSNLLVIPNQSALVAGQRAISFYFHELAGASAQQLATYVWARQGAAPNCLVSKAQSAS